MGNAGICRIDGRVFLWRKHPTRHGALVREIIVLKNDVFCVCFFSFSESHVGLPEGMPNLQTKHCHFRWRPEHTIAIHWIILHTSPYPKKKMIQYTSFIGWKSHAFGQIQLEICGICPRIKPGTTTVTLK